MADFARLEILFFGALAKTQPEERQRYLDAECGQDNALREQVERLLAGQVAAGSFLEKPAAPEATQAYAVANETESEQIGTQIGPYKLLQKLGEGGMGTVWVAEQEQPVKRRVALKLVKAGMDSAQVIRRFEAERQALALMDHTNIAKVLDAGTSASGRPYFVMELVKGVPITKYCDEVHASIKNRLELYVQVCSAVQHAHQKGIIHRDIKPSNVLIAMQDGKPVPKVIDFGVAKALHSKLADQTMYTEIGQIIGTLEYMAPEQAELSAMDIDTRADIYALGVLLYELLTGSTPITRERMKSAAFAEVIRLIKEEDPPKPSTRLTQSKESLANLAALRKTDPKHLSAELKGELDWVVLKALEKDRTCRYETANGLARDIQRYLADEVVEARPPSAGYRLRKFVRRNKGKVMAAGLVFLTLLVGMVGTMWGVVEARKQEQLAKERAQAEQQARKESQLRLSQIEKNNQFLLSIFDDIDINKIRDGKEPLEAVLAKRLVKVANQLDGDSVGDQLMVAELQNKLGESLLHLGYSAEAIPLFRKARDTRKNMLGMNNHDTLASMNNLALSYSDAGQFDKAIPLYEETLPLMRKLMGDNHLDSLNNMGNLAEIYRTTGQPQKALLLAEETLKLKRQKLGADHASTILCMANLAAVYHTLGQNNKAITLQTEALKRMTDSQGAEHPETLICMTNLASYYLAKNEFQQAISLFEKCLTLRKKIMGADHPDTLLNMNNLAMAYSEGGQRDKATQLYRESLKGLKSKLGNDHPMTLVTMTNLGTSYRDAGQLEKALPLFEQASQGIDKLRFQYEYAERIITNTIQAYEKAKHYDLALAWRQKWLKALKDQHGTESTQYLNFHKQTAEVLDRLIQFYTETNKPDEVKKYTELRAKYPLTIEK